MDSEVPPLRVKHHFLAPCAEDSQSLITGFRRGFFVLGVVPWSSGNREWKRRESLPDAQIVRRKLILSQCVLWLYVSRAISWTFLGDGGRISDRKKLKINDAVEIIVLSSFLIPVVGQGFRVLSCGAGHA